MNTTEIALALTVREADGRDDVAATLEGIAVPYDSPTLIGPGVREQFAQGAFDTADVVGKPLAWRHNEPIGKITEAHNTSAGLHITADVANTVLGRDAATLLRTGSVTGLSVGFTPTASARSKTGDLITRLKASLGELSLTHMPAYATAGVSVVREGETMTVTTEVETAVVPAPAPDLSGFATRDQVDELHRELAIVRKAPAVTVPRPSDPAEFFRSYKDSLLTRAWTNVTLDGTASDVPMVPSTVSARIDAGRPTWAALGAQPLPPEGMEAVWMLDGTDPLVDTQATEKTEIASGPANGLQVKTDVVTIAGGNDLSMQFIQRAHGWTLADYLERLGDVYASKTNAYLLAQLAAGKNTTGVVLPKAIDTAGLGTALGTGAAVMAAAIKKAPTVVVLAPSEFFEIGVACGQGYPVAGGNVGNADLASLSYTAFGLRFVCEPALATGTVKGYLLHGGMIGIKESAGAPYSLVANVPSKVGQDFAIYGYAAAKVLRAGGVLQITRAAT